MHLIFVVWVLGLFCPAVIYLFKVHNRSTRIICEVCSKLTLKDTTMTSIIKTPEHVFWCLYCWLWTYVFLLFPWPGKYLPSISSIAVRKKCPYSELFWSAFFRIRTEYGEIIYLSVFSPNAGKYWPE